MVSVTSLPKSSITCPHCRASLSYDQSDLHFQPVEGFMMYGNTYGSYGIQCPNCTGYVRIRDAKS